MTVDTMPTRSCPNVFEAGLPILAYEHLEIPNRRTDSSRTPGVERRSPSGPMARKY